MAIEQNTQIEARDGGNKNNVTLDLKELYGPTGSAPVTDRFNTANNADVNAMLNGFDVSDGSTGGKNAGDVKPALIRDDKGFIVNQENAWGSQDVKYQENGQVSEITFKSADGKVETYKRNPETGMMESETGTGKTVYQDIKVNQETGEILFQKKDGSGFTHTSDGQVWGFNEQGQTTSHFDPKTNTYTTWKYDGMSGTTPTQTTTIDLDTNTVDNDARRPRTNLFPTGTQVIPDPPRQRDQGPEKPPEQKPQPVQSPPGARAGISAY